MKLFTTIGSFAICLSLNATAIAQDFTPEEASATIFNHGFALDTPLSPDPGLYTLHTAVGTPADGQLLVTVGGVAANYTSASGDIDTIGTLITDDQSPILVTERDWEKGDGMTCVVEFNISTAGPDLFPDGFDIGGVPLVGGFFFLGLVAAGPVGFTIDGPAIVSLATIERIKNGVSVGPSDITSFSSFTAGAGGGWDGNVGVHYGAGTTGEFTTSVTLTVEYTQDGQCSLLLPVELSSFGSTVSASQVLLEWITESEKSNSGFEIEIAEGGAFSRIGFVEGVGNSTERKEYRFETEHLEPGTYSFRLKQIDFDGSIEYSEVIESVVTVPEGYLIGQAYPNPFNPSTNLEIGVETDQYVRVKIYNTAGQLVSIAFEGDLLANQMHAINLDFQGLPSGQYLAAVEGSNWVTHRMLSLSK